MTCQESVRAFLAARSDRLEPLGSGMEGTVHALDGDRVAKVWRDREAPSVLRLAEFTSSLGDLRLPFRIAEVLEVHDVSGVTITIERRVHGVPLERRLADGSCDAARAMEAELVVLAGLAEAGPLAAARDLPVLGEPAPLVGDAGFGSSLAGLVTRRAGRSDGPLAKAVDRFEEKVQALQVLLPALDAGRRAVLHGDLFPGNVLIDDAGSIAVLDWGFLTTEGDPAFDAAVTSALFDMYGPEAIDRELAFLSEVEARFGYERRTLLTCRAAYSMATATVYAPDGSDGHFAWCAAALNRADVSDALLA